MRKPWGVFKMGILNVLSCRDQVGRQAAGKTHLLTPPMATGLGAMRPHRGMRRSSDLGGHREMR